MLLKLDPFAPSGISIDEEPKVITRGGFAGSPDITRVLQPGTNVTFTGNGTQQSPYVISATGGGGGSGITRVIASVTTTITGASAASTDYVYLIGSGGIYTQPTAVGNTNRYTLKNVDTISKTISFTGAQTADGSTTVVLTPNTAIDLISDNTNWRII